MKYKFDYKITALDLWQISMYGIYSSMVGVSNIIFTVAMLLLTARLWGEAHIIVKILLIFGISLFPVIQPIAIYIRAKRKVQAIPRDLEIAFDDSGMHIKSEKQSSILKWNEITGVTKRPKMIVVYTKYKHGYVLPNKLLGKGKDDFYSYITLKIDMRQS
jgi:hypothetical protein